jgi:hypothetical protein
MTPQNNWLHVAKQASAEMDSAKLMTLVSKLCEAIEGECLENSRQHVITDSATI